MARQYMDEQITTIIQEMEEDTEQMLQETRLAQEIVEQNIESGQVVINGEIVTFAPRQFLDGQMSITIPTEWTDLPPDLAKLKYPYEDRPTIILTDETTAFNLVINYLPQPLEQAGVKECTNSLRLYTGNMTKAKFVGNGLVKHEEKELMIGWYAFVVPGFDEELYSFVCCTALAHRGLLVSFNCLASQKERWHAVALAMMNTLTLTPNEEKQIIQEGTGYVLRSNR